MTDLTDHLTQFVKYWRTLSGDEKGEAQVFCDRLFQAFGHAGYKEAGATLEFRVKRKGDGRGTSFADLVWKPRVLIEMKKRGERLQLHFRQAFDYWLHLVPDRPRYVVLCNFDEFWIYDFDKQLDQPVDIVATRELAKRYLALSFLFPENPSPIFGNDREAVTREVAEHVAQMFRSLVKRGEDRAKAQRFVLQTVVAMFAEDVDLYTSNTVFDTFPWPQTPSAKAVLRLRPLRSATSAGSFVASTASPCANCTAHWKSRANTPWRQHTRLSTTR